LLSNDELSLRALDELRHALVEQSGSIKLHAAESLYALGFGEHVLGYFKHELLRDESTPSQQVCMWRVLAQAELTEAKRSHYVDKIRDAYLSSDSPDRVSAAESLSKLHYRIDDAHRSRYERAMEELPAAAMPYARWLFAVSGDIPDLQKLADLLNNPEPMIRGVAAYALRHLRDKLPPAIIDRIAEVTIAEPPSVGRKYLICAAYVTASDASRAATFKASLVEYAKSGDRAEKYEVASALAIRGERIDLSLLSHLLSDNDPDVRVGAATAVLQILRRSAQPLSNAGPHMLHDPKIAQRLDSTRIGQRLS